MDGDDVIDAPRRIPAVSRAATRVSAVDAARWYDAFYSDADYRWEARRVLSEIRARNPHAQSLLDVGCGSGRHLAHFARELDCVGLDLDRGALRLARERVPAGTRLVHGDLTRLALDRRFDAITSLFSAIGFARTAPTMRRVVRSFARGLTPGGVVVIEPWRFAGDPVPRPTRETATLDGTRLVRVITETVTRGVTRLDISYTATSGDRTRVRNDVHELGLFSREQYATALTDAGFDVEFDPVGLTYRGLFIGVRRR
jgi:dTDP-3-amino-3,4,6-trideoxy-alpha-D-glucopyranose N,N-dimethyltransferase